MAELEADTKPLDPLFRSRNVLQHRARFSQPIAQTVFPCCTVVEPMRVRHVDETWRWSGTVVVQLVFVFVEWAEMRLCKTEQRGEKNLLEPNTAWSDPLGLEIASFAHWGWRPYRFGMMGYLANAACVPENSDMPILSIYPTSSWGKRRIWRVICFGCHSQTRYSHHIAGQLGLSSW